MSLRGDLALSGYSSASGASENDEASENEDNKMTTNIKVKMGVSSNDAPTDFIEGRLSFNITKKVIYLDWKGVRYVFGEQTPCQPQWIDHDEEDEEDDPEDDKPSPREGLDYSPYLDKILEVEGYIGRKVEARFTDKPIDYRPFLRKLLEVEGYIGDVNLIG